MELEDTVGVGTRCETQFRNAIGCSRKQSVWTPVKFITSVFNTIQPVVIRLLAIGGILILAACGSGQTAEVAATATLPATAGPVSSPETTAPTSTPTTNPTGTPLPVLTEAPTLAPTAAPPPTPVPETIACNGVLTPAQTEGPFYTPNTPERANLVEAGMGGTPLLITGKVLNQNCEPVVGAKLDFWQTDDNGQYDNNGYRMRGHQFSSENGEYRLETIVPGLYPGRTPHIHVKIFAPDGQEILTSQIYFSGVSDQAPDGIYRADLLAQDLPPESDGRRHVGFDFMVSN